MRIWSDEKRNSICEIDYDKLVSKTLATLGQFTSNDTVSADAVGIQMPQINR